jgi:hypothetical protein
MILISITCLPAIEVTSLAQEVDKTVTITRATSTTQPVSTTRPASTTQPTTAPAEDEETEMLTEDSGEAAAQLKYGIIRSNALGADREPEPPKYVETLDKHGQNFKLSGLEEFDWLQFGMQHRTRFVHRDDYYRENLQSDDPILMRTRGYLGIHKVLDPLRLGFEFQDSRSFSRNLASDLQEDPSATDEADVLQAFAELYFDGALGDGQSFSLQAGRLSFDAVDRRLLARNRFRNTTNAFDGFRIQIGSSGSRWQLTGFAMMPVERFPTARDRCNEDEWFYGVAGYWRQWSPYIILEPYYFILDQDREGQVNPDREIHTLGLHSFGYLGDTGFDYDFNTAFQFGSSGDLSQRAFAMHAELGYYIDRPTKPRIAVWLNYASGDRDPYDGINQRFDRLFGASHNMYGHSGLFTWQNIINPTFYASVRPIERMRLEAFYRTYWLASDTDAFVLAELQDPTGNSGDFVGQEIDLRLRYQLTRHWSLDVGYSHFMPGTFVTNTSSPADDSDFFYIQTTLRF